MLESIILTVAAAVVIFYYTITVYILRKFVSKRLNSQRKNLIIVFSLLMVAYAIRPLYETV